MEELAWHFVAGELGAAVFLEPLRVECGTLVEGDRRSDDLGAVATGESHNGHIVDVGVSSEHFFHLDGVDVEATGDDDLLETGDNLDVALVVHHSDVPGAVPAVDKAGLGGLGLVEVALEHLGALGLNLALLAVGKHPGGILGVTNADHCVREGNADPAGTAVAIHGVAREDGGALGEAVALHEATTRGGFPPFDERNRQCRSAREGVIDTGNVGARLLCRLEDLLVQCGDTRNEGRRVLLHHLHDELEIWGGQKHHLGAAVERQRGSKRHAVGVEEGKSSEDALVLVGEPGDPRGTHLYVGVQVAVRELGTLGHAGGAGGVQDDSGIILGHLGEFDVGAVAADGGRAQRFPRHRVGGEARELLAGLTQRGQRNPQGELHVARHRVDEVDGDNRLQRGGGAQLLQRRAGLVKADGDAGTVILERLFQLVGRVQRVVLDNDGAELEDGVERDDVLRAVRHRESDAVTGPHTERAQAGGCATHLLVQLRKSHGAAEEVGCRLIRVVGEVLPV